jgi:exosortase B
VVILFLFWQKREQLHPNSVIRTWPVLGSLSIGFGLLCYVFGRSLDILILDIGSQIFVFSGILLLTRGLPALRAMWFPLFFILFMIPQPAIILDAVTLPMKMAVSFVAENVLFWFGYPISRTGVILQIGQYQLLVADACAGMHTLISLEALGLLYLNLVRHDSLFRNITLAILIVPISFTANVIRVMVLTLVTYYFGDAAGQGFVHGFAGMVLFIVALTLIMGVDSSLQYFVKRRFGV